jgi:hypothetical protein
MVNNSMDNDTFRNNPSYVIIHYFCGRFLGPGKLNDNCGKMTHIGTVDRAFTVCESELYDVSRSVFGRCRTYVDPGGQSFEIAL